jgi:hypothetical protein
MCGPCGVTGGAPDGGTAPEGGAVHDGGSGLDGGASGCSLYGQLCQTSADCCNGVQCTGGRCEIPVQ